MAYFDCQIVRGGGGVILTVTCDAVYAGTTITATDGETTLTATCPSSSPYTVEFKLPNSGSWTISGTYSGQTQTTTVVIPDSATLHPPVPTGSTVTPVNDIQTWLHCANVWDKTYTTISQVLADTSLVTTLIASNNAADYMARSTSWASSVTANSSAMTKIGANDYCANKLLANSTWLNAICNSTYFESVLNVKVPTMTSNTSPSGVASASSVYSSNYEPWKAFNNITSSGLNCWLSTSGTTTRENWIQYGFTSNISVKKIRLLFSEDQWNFSMSGVSQIRIEGSNNGTDMTVLATYNNPSKSEYYTIQNNNKYKYMRLVVKGYSNYSAESGVSYAVAIRLLQFYGRT